MGLKIRQARAIAAASAFALASAAHAQVATAPAIDADDIGGVVSGPKGPEAGVWVIAETRDLPVRFIRIVATDDQGRFVVPDLPKASYDIWVRGYGLVDSDKVKAEPGKSLSLTAKIAPDDAAAAHYYPAIYWFSMLKIPGADQFGGKSDIPEKIKQTDWLNLLKNNGCVGCHQLGQLSTRTIPKSLGEFASHEEAWLRRVQSGQAGESMVNIIAGELNAVPVKYFGDWTQRVANGELPKSKPQRPQGEERNIVVTLRDWMTEKHYIHDLIASDKRNPTVNANGPLYGSPEYSSDMMPILDPVKNVATTFQMPVTADTPEALGPGHAASIDILEPSPYWGSEKLWTSRANNHNAMFDAKGRVWMAATGHPPQNPDFCRKGSEHPSAKVAPIERTNRRVTMFDPKTQKYVALQTCFGAHHPQFGFDKDETLWLSGGGAVLGWVNTRIWDETGDVQKAQGWTPIVLDTNGNGKRDAYTEIGKPAEEGKDRRIQANFYAIMPHPTDGSVWGSIRANPGAVVRVQPGDNPSETAVAEIYNVPMPGFGVRGGDIDKKGVVWVSLASGHIGSFDRSKCKGPLNGPKATGNHCPEGWAFYKYPGPGFEGLGDNSAESSYYTWVDQHNIFGLGEDVPMSTGNLNDGLIAFKDGKPITLRVPYPMGFYAKGFDGRIDDPNGGWKGRGLWAANGDRTPWLIEGGKGSKPLAAHFQLRPDPLAK
ncbi:MAG: hypothetical protein JWL93_1373 [Hyphomicrobiales bacterium]|nr:hypothetical protein [Hyphomicrobiales bacterium]